MKRNATTFLSTIFHFQSTLTLQQNMHMRIPLNSPQCSSFALSKLEYVCTYVLQFQVCGMENFFSTPHLTFQARVDFQWCVELEMESLLSIPYFQCGIPGECCISFHLYRILSGPTIICFSRSKRVNGYAYTLDRKKTCSHAKFQV